MLKMFLFAVLLYTAVVPAFAQSDLSELEFSEIANHTTATCEGYNGKGFEIILTDIKSKDHKRRFLVMSIINNAIAYGTADSMTGATDFFIQWDVDGSVNTYEGGEFKLTKLGEHYRLAGER